MRNRFIYKLFAVIMCLTMLLSSFTCLWVNGEEADGGAVFGRQKFSRGHRGTFYKKFP